MLNFNLSGRGKYSGKGHHAFMQRLDRLQGEREAHEEKGLIERVLGMTAGEVVDTIEPGIAFNTNAPVLSETVSKDGVYIDENTLLIIPPHLLRQSPFFLLAEGKNELLLTDLAGLAIDQRDAAIRMLAFLDVKIKNGDFTHTIKLNQKISILGKPGSLNQYLNSPHQISLG